MKESARNDKRNPKYISFKGSFLQKTEAPSGSYLISRKIEELT